MFTICDISHMHEIQYSYDNECWVYPNKAFFVSMLQIGINVRQKLIKFTVNYRSGYNIQKDKKMN